MWTFGALNQCIPVSSDQGSVSTGSIKACLKPQNAEKEPFRGNSLVRLLPHRLPIWATSQSI